MFQQPKQVFFMGEKQTKKEDIVDIVDIVDIRKAGPAYFKTMLEDVYPFYVDKTVPAYIIVFP